MKDYREKIVEILSNHVKLPKDMLNRNLEIPKDSNLGDFTFPCYILAKELKNNPVDIAQNLASKIKSMDFDKIIAVGPYINFFINKNYIAKSALGRIQKEKNNYGYQNLGKNKTILVEMSSPNVAKLFGIGHLRSTIIGNSIANIFKAMGYKVIKINYIGDWGTQFGKILAAYKEFGSEKKLKKDPIKHLYEIYVKASEDKSFEEKGREYFKRLENGDKKLIKMWKRFRNLSINDFDQIYETLNINFDILSGESDYKDKLEETIKLLKKAKLLKVSEGAEIVDLESYGLGICLIKKSDGTTLYSTRDIAAAIDRYNKYKFDKMIYEVGAEQTLHFKQLFKILELLGFSWAKSLVHVDHGLYLDQNNKKLSTRKGKTIFMEEVLEETKALAKKEILKREKLTSNQLEERSLAIARAAIFYGDLKNYRTHNMIFDISKFISFEGDTGPYLLYTFARARSILKKAQYKKTKFKVENLSNIEKSLISHLASFSDVIAHSASNYDPSEIAKYSYKISQVFNEFYHNTKVIGSDNESFRLALVDSFSYVLKNALNLLGINIIERM